MNRNVLAPRRPAVSMGGLVRTSWSRRLAATALAMAVALPVLGAPTAGAAAAVDEPVDVARVSDRILDPAAYGGISFRQTVNAGTFQQDGIFTYAGWQYTAWYQDDVDGRRAAVARRQLPDGAWESTSTEFLLGGNDSHNNISMVVSPADGRIHLAAGIRGSGAGIRYMATAAGAAEDPASVEWTSALFGPVTNVPPGLAVQGFSYPRFEVVNGETLLSLRTGGSNDGRNGFARYDEGTGRWTWQGHYTHNLGLYTAPDGKTAQTRNAYHHGFTYNETLDRLEISFSWRERETAWCTGSAVGTHDLGYAYSEDAGRTWLNNDGQQVAVTTLGDTSGNITPWSDGVVVVDIPLNSGLINQETQNIDSQGRLHVVTSRVPDEDIPADGCVRSLYDDREASAVPYHHWRDVDGTWRTMQLPVTNNSSGRSKIVFGSDDTAYVVLPDARIIAATAASGWTDWTVVFEDPAVDNVSETVVDTSRLATEDVLSVIYQEATTGSPSAFRVADFALGSTAEDAPRDTTPVAPPTPVQGSTNLALNPAASGFPAAFASSAQANQPARLANDGSADTFWVSSGLVAGQGPTPTAPQFVGVDLGAPTTFTQVAMIPRPRPTASALGPSDYSIEVSDDGTIWTPVAEVRGAPRSTTVTTDFAPLTARYVRLLIRGSYPVGGANVQVSELEIRDRRRPNRDPSTQDVLLATDEDTSVEGRVRASDPDQFDVLTYDFETPRHGVVSGDSRTGVFEYTPEGGFVGTDSFIVTVTDSSGGTAQALVELTVADNLARNRSGEGLPTAFASSTQGGAFLPAAANDGDPQTFWVSGGLRPGDGPTPDDPELIGVDLDSPARLTHVSMTPRIRSDGGGATGPIDYVVETSTDGQSWTAVAQVVGARSNQTVTTDVGTVVASQVRLVITRSNAGSFGGEAPNTQVAELGLRDLTPNTAPEVASLTLSTQRDATVEGEVRAIDRDGDLLSYGFGAPRTGSVDGDAVTGSFRYTPADGFVGEDQFEVTATDDAGASSIAVVTITVELPSQPQTKQECKSGGWADFTDPAFRNQGQCIAWVNAHAQPRDAPRRQPR